MLITKTHPRRLGIFGAAMLLLSPWTNAFCPAARTLVFSRTTSRGVVPIPNSSSSSIKSLRSSSCSLLYATSQDQDTTTTETPEQVMDDFLDSGKLRRAVRYLKENPSLDISRERWAKVFDAIEIRTTEAEENNVNTRAMASSEYPPLSPARMEMTDMYATLKELDHLQLYGAAASGGEKTMIPAAGSHVVTPTLLEQITDLSMTALTPRPTNSLLFAGIALAVLEGFVSLVTGVDFNFLAFVTLLLAFLDRFLVNGVVFENFMKAFMPGIENKILRHEAGHFLCAYLMGCPVEGCVLSAWAALQDARFGGRRTNVSAGTSFFDPQLSEQINSSVVTRSSIDRYSIIVMGGIAAEAVNFGQADGGAGDEMALVALLSRMNARPKSGGIPPWNETSIKNQARWGALQAVLLIRHYKACYEALVDALERGGNLGDCIYAIEKAGRDNKLQPLKEPLGYILDKGDFGEWTTEKPENTVLGPYSSMLEASEKKEASSSTPPLDEREAAEKLKEYRKVMEEKLRDIDERLKESE